MHFCLGSCLHCRHYCSDDVQLELRKQTSEEFKALSGAAQDAGVQSKMFGVFHDAGYKGLYGGLNSAAIKTRKAIPDKDNLLDRMNATELAANQFRMTQTRDKLARDGVSNQAKAIQVHEQVGKEVRQAIERIGGTPPEKIPPAEHIKEVEIRMRQLKLDPEVGTANTMRTVLVNSTIDTLLGLDAANTHPLTASAGVYIPAAPATPLYTAEQSKVAYVAMNVINEMSIDLAYFLRVESLLALSCTTLMMC